MKKEKQYTLQNIGQAVDGLVHSVDILTETVGQVLIEQTIMKEDIAVLKTDVSGLKTDVSGLKGDVAELRNDMATVKTHLYIHDKRFDAQDNKLDHHEFWLQNISEDIRVILPNHEVRIAKLEKTTAGKTN